MHSVCNNILVLTVVTSKNKTDTIEINCFVSITHNK